MQTLYHGTGLETIFAIARAGAILSPLERKTERLKSFNRSPEEFKKIFGKNIEELAFIMATSPYQERQLMRAQTVSMARVLHHAIGYADSNQGGAVLGIEFDDVLPKELNAIERIVIFIPKKVVLTRLKEIHISPEAKNYEQLIREAYAKYNPNYFYL